ncbi:MAG: hypothetical protein RIS64_1864 [Bacteroidota bacterium]|jgi:uncharacterized protein (TIGR02284 family)
MNIENSIEALNSLIEINNDRIEGYKTAVDQTDEADLKNLFSECIKTSEKCKSELVSEVRHLNGTPAEGTKTTGKIYRVWMDFKALITGKSRSAILNSCVYGEEVARDAYMDALNTCSMDLNDQQIALLKTQLAMLKADFTKVKGLKELATL